MSKPEAIVLAAKRVFLEKGFQYATMDEIAAQAQTTKRTVYNHFKNKEELFHAIIAEVSRLFLAKLPVPDRASEDIGGQFKAFAARFSELCSWSDAVSLQRVLLSEFHQFPDLSRELYESAAMSAEAILAGYIEYLGKNGRLAVTDPLLAARLLLDGATASARLRALYGVDEPLSGPPEPTTSTEVEMGIVNEAVSSFLKAYATD